MVTVLKMAFVRLARGCFLSGGGGAGCYPPDFRFDGGVFSCEQAPKIRYGRMGANYRYYRGNVDIIMSGESFAK